MMIKRLRTSLRMLAVLEERERLSLTLPKMKKMMLSFLTMKL